MSQKKKIGFILGAILIVSILLFSGYVLARYYKDGSNLFKGAGIGFLSTRYSCIKTLTSASCRSNSRGTFRSLAECQKSCSIKPLVTTKPVSGCSWCGNQCILSSTSVGKYCATVMPPTGASCQNVNGICQITISTTKPLVTTTTTVTTKPIICTDTDGGKNYNVKGTTYGTFQRGNGPETINWVDTCVNSSILTEYSCKTITDSSANPLDVWSDSYTCPNGCENGACKKATTATNCLKSGVCVNDNILLITQKEGGPFITYGTYNGSSGEMLQDREVTKFYSQHVKNEADFLIVFRDFDGASLSTYQVPIKTNISGIGLDNQRGDTSSNYGTKGGLKGFASMPNIMLFRESLYFERELINAVHEFGHSWLMFLANPKLPISDGIHYSKCFQSGNESYIDPMGYTGWVQTSEHDFISKYPSNATADYKFTTLSLYLMGLIPKESVSPMYFIEPSDGSNNCMVNPYDGYNHVTGTKKEVTMEEIIKMYGERIPNYLNSPKNFTIQFALVAHENSNLTQGDVDNFQRFIDEFPNYFSFATSNKASVKIIPFDRS